MSSTTHVVSLSNIQKTFVTRHFFQLDEDTHKRQIYRKRVVNAAMNVSFGIRRGEIFGLLGPNGAGKTTTVKMISGLVKPDGGVVEVEGMDVERWRHRILQRVGVVLEGTRTSIWPLTPLENLAYYGNLKNVTGKRLFERSHELLDFIGLKDQKNVQVRYLSRGQKQKLAICIALIADPQVLLLDEPTTGLDVQSSRSIKDKIIQMTREQGKSVLVTTHDMHVAQELCDRVGIINHGELVACKTTEELLTLFSDQQFEFRVDREPAAGRFQEIRGVREVSTTLSADGAVLTVRLVREPDKRSAALYEIVSTLHGDGYRLLGVNQHQESLESVFLQLTGPGPKR
ncbi:MAG: ABC transporter ATP-binding protein [Candidatus Hydrogenedentes bacterium]|nr:ABC transporter ATP-binding protein [Candidatus Hydrogenedentota bacterium]